MERTRTMRSSSSGASQGRHEPPRRRDGPPRRFAVSGVPHPPSPPVINPRASLHSAVTDPPPQRVARSSLHSMDKQSFRLAGDRLKVSTLAVARKVTPVTVPKLRLQPDDELELRLLATDLENEVLQVYEKFLFQRRQVDETRWRHVRSQDDLHVYSERGGGPQRSESRLLSQGGVLGPQAATAEFSRMPLKLVTGTVPGTVDDAMFGGSMYDTPSLRTRNAYQKEHMEDNAVLATIEGASEDDPYRFLGVVWYLKKFPMPALISSRDMVLLSHIHVSRRSNGERIGVHLYHSIDHTDVPEFEELSVLRMRVSLVIIFRQLDDRCVEVFMMDFLDPMGHTPVAFNTQEGAKTLLASANICDTGFKKKLHWLMRERQRKNSMPRLARDESVPPNCVVCEKQLGGFFSSSGCICQLCSKRVCSKCSVTKIIIISATATTMERKPFNFCIMCIVIAKRRSTYTIAQNEWMDRLRSDPHPTASTSTSAASS